MTASLRLGEQCWASSANLRLFSVLSKMMSALCGSKLANLTEPSSRPEEHMSVADQARHVAARSYRLTAPRRAITTRYPLPREVLMIATEKARPANTSVKEIADILALTIEELRQQLLEELPHVRAFAVFLTGRMDRADDLAERTILR